MSPVFATSTSAFLPAKAVYAACVRVLATEESLDDDLLEKIIRIRNLSKAANFEAQEFASTNPGSVMISADDFNLIAHVFSFRTDDVIPLY